MKPKITHNDGCDKLWAPWRMAYIDNIGCKDEGCIFCTKPEQDDDEGNFIVHRGKTCFIILNIYPYNNGHLMVVPYKHTSDITTLSSEETCEMMEATTLAVNTMRKIMRPDGFNLGMNMGRTAGAGIDEHLHMHLVPRWNGDTNFMPVLCSTKVISESLGETYNRLKQAIREELDVD